MTIRSVGRVQTMEEIANLRMKFGSRVMPLAVKDVAEGGIGSQFRTGASTMNGEEAVGCRVMMLSAANSRVVGQEADSKVKEVREKLSDGVLGRTPSHRSRLVTPPT